MEATKNRRHFLSVLGTSNYEPCRYRYQDFLSEGTPFIQEAAIDFWLRDAKEGDYITIFTTKKARNSNWEDREYTEDDISRMKYWKSNTTQMIVAGERHVGLKSILEDKALPIEAVAIPDGTSLDEQWEIFSIMYDSLQKGDEVTFDITHSFRSIPMLALAMLSYAKTLKQISINAIVYGAFEGAIKENGNAFKTAEIIDLTSFSRILDWTSAAEAFIQYGNAGLINQMCKEVTVSEGNRRTVDEINLLKLSESMQILSNCLMTSRGKVINKETKDRKLVKKSIQQAYHLFVERCEMINESNDKSYLPLFQLIEEAKKRFHMLDQDSDTALGLSVVAWCIRNGSIQQGFTALDETIKTGLCEQFGFDCYNEEDRDGCVKKALTFIMRCFVRLKNEQPNKSKEELTDGKRMYELAKQDEMFYKMSRPIKEAGRTICECEFLQDKYDRLHDFFMLVPFPLVSLSDKVSKARNDLNHFGFQKDPKNAENFKPELEEYYKEAKDLLENLKEIQQDANE